MEWLSSQEYEIGAHPDGHDPPIGLLIPAMTGTMVVRA
jgi:hypothetical protein